MLNLSGYAHRETATHIYFLGGPFSQWWPAAFVERLAPNGNRLLFNCAEQYMMARKAFLFEDFETLGKILLAPNPKEQKQLGREVRNFDPTAWDAVARDVVARGNFAKFTQDAELLRFIQAKSGKILVEGAYYDTIWGVGLSWDDPAIEDETNWKGKNWLGLCLMKIQDQLLNGDPGWTWSW